MALVDDLVATLSEESLAGVISQEEVRNRIVSAISLVERRPLRCREVHALREAFADAMKSYSLDTDQKLVDLIDSRFSFEFVPRISKLGFEKVISVNTGIDVEPKVISSNEKSTINKDSRSSSSSRLHTIDAFATPSDKKLYLLCSVKRQQTAMWTSYRLFLDGVHEFDSAGALLPAAMNDSPVELLGAKKLKSGANAQGLIWNVPDIKLWKEKNAAGKFTRVQTSLYTGMLVETALSAPPPLPSPLPPQHATSLASIDTSSEAGDTPAPSPYPFPPRPPSAVTTTDAPASAEDTTQPAGIAMGAKAASTRWSFRSAVSTTLLPQAGSVPTVEGGIALSMHTKGMEKLIQFHAVAVRKSAAGLEPAAVNLTEQQLSDKVEALTQQNTAPSDFANPALLLLRSRPPRKVPGAGGKPVLSVPFGKITRVRAPSRKNLVVDVVTAGSSAEPTEVAAEWMADNSKPAVLQFGKLDEGHFVLDFYELTPFQAFCIALAAFDQ